MNSEESTPSLRKPQVSVGHTDVTGMVDIDARTDSSPNEEEIVSSCESTSKSKGISMRVTVSKATAAICVVVPPEQGGCRKIVESLVWVFVSRRSLREVPFSDKEYGRFINSMKVTAKRLSDVASEDCREQSMCKYFVDDLLAKAFKDEFDKPVKPDWIPCSSLFSGWCQLFVHRRLAKRDLSFFYSLSKGAKQIWEKLSPVNLAATIVKTRDRLTKPNLDPIPKDLENTITSVSRGIFSNIQVSGSGNLVGVKLMPTSSACSQASVHDGGALSIFEALEKPSVKDVRVLGRLRSILSSGETWRRRVVNECIEGVREGFEGGDLFDVRYSPIYEPAKIRGVSVGDGYLYTLLQPMQGEMLDSWKRSRWSTMLYGDLLKRVSEIEQMLGEEDYWCSGDYEAATDLLKKRASLLAFLGVPESNLRSLAYMSLATGRITFPNPEFVLLEHEFKKSGKPKSQWDAFLKEKGYPDGISSKQTLPLEEGQLMGHPLSFPLLCVINLAVLRCSIDRWVDLAKSKAERLLRRIRGNKIYNLALVNGDDILFKGPMDLIQIFKSTSSEAGFKVSAGKNYVSRDCCMINSQVFRRVDGKMVRFGYLNLRLVKGVNVKARKAAGENSVNPVNIGKDLSQMVELCPWSLCSVPEAFSRWDREIRDFGWFRPNWYLPTHLGGYGFNPDYRPDSFRVTRSQRILAACFVHDTALQLFRSRSVPIKVGRSMGALLNLRPVYGDYVPSGGEELVGVDSSDWEARFMYLNQAALAGSSIRGEHPAYVFESCLLANKIKRNTRMHPMSLEALESYKNVRYYAFKVGPCPPQPYVILPEGMTDWELLHFQ